MKVYYINLDRSPERRAFMEEQLARAGVDGERVAAVDGRTIDMSGYSHTTLREPEIGCLLSHKDAWNRLLASGDAYAVILEDDARLSAEIAPFLTSDAWIPKDVSLVKLDTMLYLTTTSRHGWSVLDRRVYTLVADHVGAAGYILSRGAAEQLLLVSETALVPVDIYLFCGKYLEITRPVQMVPALVLQRSTFAGENDVAFQSLLEHVELEQIVTPRPPKPKGLRKLFREVSRPFLRGGKALKVLLFGPDHRVVPFR